MGRHKIMEFTGPTECVLCSHSKASYHYGALVCSRCKMFFHRAVRSELSTNCSSSNKCGASTQCPSCRFQKCLRMGMKKEEVGIQHDHRNRLANEKLVPLLEQYLVPYEKQLESITNGKEDMDPVDIALILLRLESFYDNDDKVKPINYNFAYTMDISFEEAFYDPIKISERTPIGFGESEPNRCLLSEGITHRIYCRSLLHYIDWCRGSPELANLKREDMITICLHQFGLLEIFTKVYNTYKYKSLGFLSAFGFRVESYYARSEASQSYGASLAYIAQEIIIPIMQEIEFSPEEFVFTKKILFFSVPLVLSEQGNAFVRAMRKKYEYGLLKYIQRFYGDTATSRLLKIFSIFPSVIKMASKADAHRAAFAIFDFMKMNSKLTKDIHVNKLM